VPVSFKSGFEKMADGRLCLWAVGELDAAAAPVLSEAIASCVLTRLVDIVLDVGGVTFMDSSGLTVLIDGHRFAWDTGVPLLLRRVPAETHG
jgi:anti-anti-sigma factor